MVSLIIYTVYLGRNTYSCHIVYILKKYIHHNITNILEKHIQTQQRIYCIIYIEEVHTNITTFTEVTLTLHINTMLVLITCLLFYHICRV